MPRQLSAPQLLDHLTAYLSEVKTALDAFSTVATEWHTQLEAVIASVERAKADVQHHPEQLLVRESKYRVLDESLLLVNVLLNAGVINEALRSQFELLDHRVFVDILLETADFMHACHTHNPEAIDELRSQGSSLLTYFADEDHAGPLQLIQGADVDSFLTAVDALSNNYNALISELTNAGCNSQLINQYRSVLTHEAAVTAVDLDQPGACSSRDLPGNTNTYYVDPARIPTTRDHSGAVFHNPPVAATGVATVFQSMQNQAVNLGAWIRDFIARHNHNQ